MMEGREHILVRLQRMILGAWIFWLVLALSWWTHNPAAPIKDLGTGWAALALSVVGCVGVASRGMPIWLGTPMQMVVAIFLLVHFVAAMFSEHRALSLFHLRTWAAYAVIMVLGAQVFRRPDEVWRVLGVVVCAVAVSSVYGFFQYFHLDPFPWANTSGEEYRGLPSTYGHPNMAGHALVLALLMGVGVVGRKVRAKSWVGAAVWAVPTAAIGMHLYLTGMRGAPVALAATGLLLGVFWVVSRWVRRPARASVVTVGLVACGGLLGIVVVLFLFLPLTGANEPLPIDGSLVLRANGYYGAAQMVFERPLFGHGPGTYPLENIAKWTAFEQQWFASENLRNMHAHNDVLEAGVEAGFLGIASYLLLLVWALLQSLAMAAGALGKDKRGIGLALAACFAAFAVGGAFDFNLRVPVSGGLFFLMLGLLDGLQPRREVGERSAKVASGALVVAGAVCAVLVTWSFAGEAALQRAAGWRLLVAERLAAGDAAEVARARVMVEVELVVGRGRLPWDRRFPAGLGQLAMEQERFSDAVGYFDAARVLDPYQPTLMVDAARAHLEMALLTRDEGALDAAVALTERALQYSPMLARAHEVLGRAAFLRATALASGSALATQWETVARHFSNALRYGVIAPAPVERMLAQVLAISGDVARAAQYFDHAAQLEPADEQGWEVFHRFAVEHGEEGAYRDSLRRHLRRALYENPVDGVTVGVLALRILAVEEYDENLRTRLLRDVLPFAPQLRLWGMYAEQLMEGARLYEIQTLLETIPTGDAVQTSSRELLYALSSLAPSSVDSLLTASTSLVGIARVLADERDATELRWVGVLLMNVSDVAEEAEGYGEFLMNVGESLVLCGEWSLAEYVLLEAVAHLEGGALGWANYQFSQALAAQDRPADAVAPAREATRYLASSALIHWNLAQRLVDAGLLNQANFQYAKLLSIFRGTEAERAAITAEHDALKVRIEGAV